jgi:hypothetical protein
MARRPHQNNNANLSGQGVGRGDATRGGLACQAEVRGPEHARRLAGQTKASALPQRAGRIGAGEVVHDRFGGPLAGLVSRQALGLVGGARRLAAPVWRPTCWRIWRTTVGHSMTARAGIVPPHRAHTSGSISYTWRIRQAQDRRRSRGA